MDNIFINKNRKWAKIIVPLIFIFIIAGIWLIKDSKKSNILISSDNPDFALHVEEDFDLEKLKSYGLPIIIDFGADYCQPCKEMAPILEEVNQEMLGKAIIKFVDVQKFYSITEEYPISVIPTQVFYNDKGNPFVPKDPGAYNMKAYSMKDTGEHIFTVHEGGLTKKQLLEIITEMEEN